MYIWSVSIFVLTYTSVHILRPVKKTSAPFFVKTSVPPPMFSSGGKAPATRLQPIKPRRSIPTHIHTQPQQPTSTNNNSSSATAAAPSRHHQPQSDSNNGIYSPNENGNQSQDREGQDRFITPGNIQHTPIASSRQLLSSWIVQAWDMISEELVKKSWIACGYPPENEL